MNNITSYIASGKIEEYCLGLSSPEEVIELESMCSRYSEIREYLSECQSAFEHYLLSLQVPLSEKMKTSITDHISVNEQFRKTKLTPEGKLSDFVDISKNIPIELYLEKLKQLKPPSEYENIHAVNIYNDGKQELNLVWVKQGVPLEYHPELDESFLILTGTADCYIDGEVTSMMPGDYMLIPTESAHEVKVTSSVPAMAIRYRRIAA
jgi:mannose-6-phosphate isomerase-like protein (cupin superfamily)